MVEDDNIHDKHVVIDNILLNFLMGSITFYLTFFLKGLKGVTGPRGRVVSIIP